MLAVQEHQAGNYATVVALYNLILGQAPDYAEAYNNRGVALQKLELYADALNSYGKAIAFKPNYANAHFNRGTTLRKLRRPEEALAAYDQAIALNPQHAEACNNRGVLLQEMKRYAEALASYNQAILLKPDYAEAHNNRGLVLASQGDMAAAETAFLKAAELRPDFSDPLFNLANSRSRHPEDAPTAGRIRALLANPALSPDNREQLLFALGKIHDDCSQYDEAFRCFQEANDIRGRTVKYDAASVEKTTAALIETHSREFLTAPFTFSSASNVPLFIVGMPRSGTTLVASILSNHPAVATAGELAAIPDLASQLQSRTGAPAPYPAAIKFIHQAAADGITSEYLNVLRRNDVQGHQHVIDKNPLNFRQVGFISTLFPNARILHCTRNPLDTCLSNYFQRFPLSLGFAFNLENTAHYFAEYSRLMEHWKTVPSIKMIDVSYEDLILNSKPAVQRLLDFLGLTWDDRCLAPHTNPCAVDTASQWQVRQPIYQSSINRWQHYEQHLAPAKNLLQCRGLFSTPGAAHV